MSSNPLPGTRTVGVALLLACCLNLGGALEAAVQSQNELVCPPAGEPARVTEAFRYQAGSTAGCEDPPAQLREVQLGDSIVVCVDNLQTLIDRAACDRKAGRQTSIILYLDQQPIPELVAYPPTDPATKRLRFPLKLSEDSGEIWNQILGAPGFDPRDVKVSVGLSDRFAQESDAQVSFRVLPTAPFALWLVIFLGLVIAFFLLASRSNMLRVPEAPGVPSDVRPYSLSRVQAAWWFFIVLASYLLIGVVTGNFSTSITGTTLVVLAISAGTALSSAVIDTQKTDPEAGAERKQLAAEMQAQLETLRSSPDSTPQVRTLAKSKADKLHNRSQGFLYDIVTDAGGVSFHRFQMAGWTLIFGVIFCIQVYDVLAMPQFSDTLLSLMGISSGTYLGLKIPEKDVPDSD